MAIDLTSPLEDCGSIHVALVPVGSIDASTFDRYSKLCSTHNTLDLFQITHGHSHGVLRLRFVAGPASDVVRNEWEDLHAHRRVRAIVGLCHCPCESNLQEAVRSLSRNRRSDAHTLLDLLLAVPRLPGWDQTLGSSEFAAPLPWVPASAKL